PSQAAGDCFGCHFDEGIWNWNYRNSLCPDTTEVEDGVMAHESGPDIIRTNGKRLRDFLAVLRTTSFKSSCIYPHSPAKVCYRATVINLDAPQSSTRGGRILLGRAEQFNPQRKLLRGCWSSC